MTLSPRPSLLQGVGVQIIYRLQASDNISREKNKQTTHLKRRNISYKAGGNKSEPCVNGPNSKINPLPATIGLFYPTES